MYNRYVTCRNTRCRLGRELFYSTSTNPTILNLTLLSLNKDPFKLVAICASNTVLCIGSGSQGKRKSQMICLIIRNAFVTGTRRQKENIK